MDIGDLNLEPSGLKKARRQAIEVLTLAYTNDDISVEEFEKRVALVHEVNDKIILSTILADLPQDKSNVTTTLKQTKSASTQNKNALVHRSADNKLYAILGTLERKGSWNPAENNRVITFMGKARIDLREALLQPGLTTLKIYGFMSDIKIIVPANISIECEGNGILGQFDFHPLERKPTDSDMPIVRIEGFVVGGTVKVIVDEGQDKPYYLVKKIASWIDKNMS